MTPLDWEFLQRLNDAFTEAEKKFKKVGRVTVGPDVVKDLYRLPQNEWKPTGNKSGKLGEIWEADIYYDGSLKGRQVILDAPSTSESSES